MITFDLFIGLVLCAAVLYLTIQLGGIMDIANAVGIAVTMAVLYGVHIVYGPRLYREKAEEYERSSSRKAVLYAEGGEIVVSCRDTLSDGTKTTVSAKGKDMQSALRTVLRTETMKRIDRLPVVLWVAGYMLTATASAYAAMYYGNPRIGWGLVCYDASPQSGIR